MSQLTNAWNEIFKERGRVFYEPHPDIPGIVKLLGDRGATKVLDLGSGTGRHTVYLARNGFTVYGLDNSPEGIKTTRQWLADEGLTADLQLRSITEKLPYEDAFFDGVISVKVINHFDSARIRNIAQEITRVLDKGGLLFVAVTTVKNMAKKFKQVEPNTFIPLDGREKGLIHHFFTQEELQEVFGSFNIVDIHLDAKEHYCMTAFKR